MSSTKNRGKQTRKRNGKCRKGLWSRRDIAVFVDRPGLCVQCRVGAKSG